MHVQHQSGGIRPGWLIERWNVGHRIRDVEEGPDGSLWMLEDAMRRFKRRIQGF
jgi:glucose/arabinose dehydrogenase